MLLDRWKEAISFVPVYGAAGVKANHNRSVPNGAAVFEATDR
jgi:hypothetical protein